MKPRGLLILLAIAVITVSLPLSIWLLSRQASAAVKEGFQGATAMVAALFEHKTTISLTDRTISITPISEIALAKQTVRLTNVFKRSWAGSECVVVAEQDFIIKYGYETSDVFQIARSGAAEQMKIPEPRILSVEPVSGAPKVLYDANCVWNRIQPADIVLITNQMHAKVRDDSQVKQFREMLKGIIENQLKALRKELDAKN